MNGFLFGENLPRVPSLPATLPITHAQDPGARPTDSRLCEHARQHGLVIAAKGADFPQRMVLGSPRRGWSICEWATSATAPLSRGWKPAGPETSRLHEGTNWATCIVIVSKL
jgi:hypothetical protein